MPDSAVKAFIVYARRDSDLKDRLLKHLQPLRQQGLISTWHDADIDGGDDWEAAITANMAESKLILLLVSPDFMASEYIQSKELAEALRRHDAGTATVIPIFLRPAFWEIADFAKLQGFPRNGQAVESSSTRTVDEALLEVARGIGHVISGLGKPSSLPTAENLEADGAAQLGGGEQEDSGRVTSGRQTAGEAYAKSSERDFDEEYRDGRPFLRLVAYPGVLNSDAVDIESDDVKNLLLRPPGLRVGGWNMNLRAGSVHHWRDGLETEGRDARLRLGTAGFMEYVQPIERAFRWREQEDGFTAGPRLYPYPVVEYPLSFITLYRDIAQESRLLGPFTFELQYWDIEGWFLAPYAPGQTGFLFADDLAPYGEKHFRSDAAVEAADYDPGEVTATLLRPLYRSFGHGPEAIPTYDKTTRRVTFDLANM